MDLFITKTVPFSEPESTIVIVRIMERGELGGCDVAGLGRRRRTRKGWSLEEDEEKNKRND